MKMIQIETKAHYYNIFGILLFCRFNGNIVDRNDVEAAILFYIFCRLWNEELELSFI